MNFRRNESSICFLDIPCCNILNFLTLHTNSDEFNNNDKHWLIKENNVSIDFFHIINPLYEKIVQDIPVEALKSKFFKAKLEKVLEIKADLPAKKTKI